ncbi:hypothetical protein KALB_1693 [Kutzneria albida DSM 43870]|uniref:Uncharacterized protein n=1 Tax=Kutzneria albida DSM 43870 TaxID=1449976 RepID=W5W2N8_9PSEU|nr:hypothetical protein KALB_1693 [Kutzneria albida DSM 43870]
MKVPFRTLSVVNGTFLAVRGCPLVVPRPAARVVKVPFGAFSVPKGAFVTVRGRPLVARRPAARVMKVPFGTFSVAKGTFVTGHVARRGCSGPVPPCREGAL